RLARSTPMNRIQSSEERPTRASQSLASQRPEPMPFASASKVEHQSGNRDGVALRLGLQEFARTGNPDELKAALESVTGVTGGTTGYMAAGWKEVRQALRQAQVDDPSGYRSLFEAGYDKHIERRFEMARASALKLEVAFMDSDLNALADAAKKAGVSGVQRRIEDLRREVAPGVFDRAQAEAALAIKDDSKAWRVQSLVQIMNTQGSLAGRSPKEIAAAVSPYLGVATREFQDSVTSLATSVKPGLFQNHIGMRAKALRAQARELFTNDRAGLKGALSQIENAKRSSASATAMGYLRQGRDELKASDGTAESDFTSAIVATYALDQARIYGKMAGYRRDFMERPGESEFRLELETLRDEIGSWHALTGPLNTFFRVAIAPWRFLMWKRD
ncbi:MAG: hypothetical protein AAF658_05170, partial [Myxococcota bacterium]